MVYKGVCDIGLKRTVNQDAIFMAAAGGTGLFCVADGMGGHSYGERASSEIVQRLEEWWKGFRAEDYYGEFARMMSALNQVLEKANERIYQMGEEKEICGTTVAVLFIHCGKYGWLSAGDSRIYLSKYSGVEQLTADDVWENQIHLSMSEYERRLHPNCGKLVNAVGIAKEMKITSMTGLLQAGTVFTLCSDGLYKMLPEKLLRGYLRKSWRYPLDITVNRMMEKVYDGGAKDNVSIVLVKM